MFENPSGKCQKGNKLSSLPGHWNIENELREESVLHLCENYHIPSSQTHTGKMVQSTVKYTAVANDVHEENDENITEGESDEEIVIDFNSPLISQQQSRKREVCFRVLLAVVLLGVVFGFVFSEWSGYWPGVEEHQDLSNHRESNKTLKTSEVEDHDHDNHHNEEDNYNDDHLKKDDHIHIEGDDHDHIEGDYEDHTEGEDHDHTEREDHDHIGGDDHDHIEGEGHDHIEGDDHDHTEGDDHDHIEGEDHDHTEGDDHDHTEGDDHDHIEGDYEDHTEGEDHDHTEREDHDHIGGDDHDHIEGEGHDHIEGDDHDHTEGEDHDHIEGEDHDHTEGEDHDHTEGEDHDHTEGEDHDHTEGEDHDHTEGEDHDHIEGDDHDHRGHVHKHSEPLYHHAALITDSGIGNVVDAGIAALLCLGVVHPHTAGIGAVFSAVLYNHTTGSFRAVHNNFQTLDKYSAPSLLQGLWLLHSSFGQLEWSRLFEGAIKLAKEGFPVDAILSRALETHREEILQSGLCDLFCDLPGFVKSEGERVTNENLSELLLSVSLNASYFPEKLSVKLAQDISETDRTVFLAAVQAGSGEINEPLIVEQEQYSILSAHSQLTGAMLSNILDRVREQHLSFQSHGDLAKASASYNALLKLGNEFFNTSLTETFTVNTASSHVGALDSHGNFIVISTSLNSTWGSGQYLPSSGVILNDFTSDTTNMPHYSFPLVLKIRADEDEDLQFVALTGGPSALFQAVVILRNMVDAGVSALETMNGPMIHLVQGDRGSLTGCVCSLTNSSVVLSMRSDGDGLVQAVGECPHDFQSMLLRLNAKHVGAYGAPAAEVHTDGY
ncbi:hypothetical protein DNTS_025283 [Danionella cerebrum]|uniref:Uncharacterized protein n=1 Tax=Danionella cerebrum TaxID=2873325 RepID=A0A553QI08_9TELE|nr:hypothetical protein DNTS_025283 [Danionella translucida]